MHSWLLCPSGAVQAKGDQDIVKESKRVDFSSVKQGSMDKEGKVEDFTKAPAAQ